MSETTSTTTPRRTKKSNDFTGNQAAQVKAQAEEKRRVEQETVAAQRAAEHQEFETTVFDATKSPSSPSVMDPADLPEIADITTVDEVVDTGAIELADHTRIIRVAEDIPNMTYGYGNTYEFKAGGRYRVPAGLADRLEKLNLVWH